MLHVLESEAQDTEDRVEAVNLKVEKVSIVHALILFLCRDSASECWMTKHFYVLLWPLSTERIFIKNSKNALKTVQ